LVSRRVDVAFMITKVGNIYYPPTESFACILPAITGYLSFLKNEIDVQRNNFAILSVHAECIDPYYQQVRISSYFCY
jgi:hypothetical protein